MNAQMLAPQGPGPGYPGSHFFIKEKVVKNDNIVSSHEIDNFCGITDQSLLYEIELTCVKNIYRKGQSIFIQGMPTAGIYFVQNGKIKISTICENGREFITEIVRSGGVIGLNQLFDDGVHRSCATCLEDTNIIFLKKYFAHYLIKNSNDFTAFCFKQMAYFTEEIEKKNLSKSLKNVRQRLAGLLIELNAKDGIKQTDGSWIFKLYLSRENMASMIGTSCETAIRFLTELKNEQIIDLKGKDLIIKDQYRLWMFSN